MTSGTDRMSRGRTLPNASRMIWGEGVCARNVIAQPDVNGNRNSKAQPNACASGRKELSRVVDEQHSRIPVYDPQRGPEHIVGVLYAKDLMRWMRLRLTQAAVLPAARISQMKIGQIMHDVLVVPETKSLFELLVEFQQRKRHLAMVVDEFGSTAGVISVEDVLEQLVGELEDEFDVASAQPAVDANAPLILDGAVNIRDLESQYDQTLPQDEGFETLAGFVLSRLQKMPKGGESFEYQGRRFVIERMDGHRVALVRVEPAPPEPLSPQISPVGTASTQK